VAREASLWSWLNNARDDLDDTLHMGRVENLVEGGWPDVEGCLCGECFTVELKSKGRPRRESTRILAPGDIRPGQVPWLERRWRAGGAASMLIQVGSGHAARRYLVPGNLACMVAGAAEGELLSMSVIDPRESAVGVVRACAGIRGRP